MTKPFVMSKRTGYARNNTISFSLNERDLILADLLVIDKVLTLRGKLIQDGVCMDLVKSTLQTKTTESGGICAVAKFR